MTSRHDSFLTLTQFIHHHLLWFLIAAYAMSAIWPAAGLGIRNLTFGDLQVFNETLHVSSLLLLLATLMFNAGLGVKPSHLKSLGQKTRVLLAGLTANLIIPMAYIFLVTLIMRLWYEPEEAQHILVGLALVAAMPIAGASTAWAQNSNGNLALSLGLVLASTVLSPILTPIALYVFGEMATEEFERVIHSVAAYGSGTFLGLWIVLPSLFGLAVRFLAPEAQLTAILPFVKLINSVVLLLLNYSNGSVSLPQAIAERDYDFLAVTLAITAGLCVTAFSSGYWLSRIFKVAEAERVSLMYGLGMTTMGTGWCWRRSSLHRIHRSWFPSFCTTSFSIWWPVGCMKLWGESQPWGLKMSNYFALPSYDCLTSRSKYPRRDSRGNHVAFTPNKRP